MREHMESENRHEFDVTMGTFDHPRYEIMATGEVYDGAEQVAEYFRTSRAAFPDQRNENAVLHHADDAVIVEFDLLGTHEGELRGIPPTVRVSAAGCALCSCSRRGERGSSASASTSTRQRSRSSCSATTLRASR